MGAWRDSGEDGLIAHALAVRSDGDEKQLKAAYHVVLDLVNPLREKRVPWPPEDKREGDAPGPVSRAPACRIAELATFDQFRRDDRGGARVDAKGIAEMRRKG